MICKCRINTQSHRAHQNRALCLNHSTLNHRTARSIKISEIAHRHTHWPAGNSSASGPHTGDVRDLRVITCIDTRNTTTVHTVRTESRCVCTQHTARVCQNCSSSLYSPASSNTINVKKFELSSLCSARSQRPNAIFSFSCYTHGPTHSAFEDALSLPHICATHTMCPVEQYSDVRNCTVAFV